MLKSEESANTVFKHYAINFPQKKQPNVNAPKQNGVIETQSNSKESSVGPSENKGKENKEQNHSQEDSDELTDNLDKKKKGMLPLLIKITMFDHNKYNNN